MAQQVIKTGVIGWPISHSRSPLIHMHWIKTYGLDGTYEAIAIDPAHFETDLRRLIDQGFAGVNVTVPHKQAALDIADHVDAVAATIGAVNTLLFHADGTIEGRNTDAHGFIQNLLAGAPGLKLEGKKAVVLGAGGAARAVLCALVDAKMGEIAITNRTQVRAAQVAGSFGGNIQVVSWEDRASVLDGTDLLVNTSSLGMVGAPALEIDLAALPLSAVVNDIVYAPLETPLLAAANARGNVTVDGLGMLLHQAAPAFEAWYGVKPTVDEALRALILADLEAS